MVLCLVLLPFQGDYRALREAIQSESEREFVTRFLQPGRDLLVTEVTGTGEDHRKVEVVGSIYGILIPD